MVSAYQIAIRGHIDPLYEAWLDPFTIEHLPSGDTLLTGAKVDQATLYGVIDRFRDLGWILISVQALREPGVQRS